jgi:hypothetical protein
LEGQKSLRWKLAIGEEAEAAENIPNAVDATEDVKNNSYLNVDGVESPDGRVNKSVKISLA